MMTTGRNNDGDVWSDRREAKARVIWVSMTHVWLCSPVSEVCHWTSVKPGPESCLDQGLRNSGSACHAVIGSACRGKDFPHLGRGDQDQ